GGGADTPSPPALTGEDRRPARAYGEGGTGGMGRVGSGLLALGARWAPPGPEPPGPEAPGPESPGPESPGPEAPGPEALGPEALGPEPPGPEELGPERKAGWRPSDRVRCCRPLALGTAHRALRVLRIQHHVHLGRGHDRSRVGS